MEIRCYRFDGLHLEPIPGAFVFPTGVMTSSTPGAIVMRPPGEHDETPTPANALVLVEVLLQRGDKIQIAGPPRSDAAVTGQRTCSIDYETYRKVCVLAPGAEITIVREIPRITILSRFRWDNDKLDFIQDAPPGC
ncbi:MAG: hypothetical protein Q7S02_04210 [bacterium]|nr:hypothetical protein [bacterium]